MSNSNGTSKAANIFAWVIIVFAIYGFISLILRFA